MVTEHDIRLADGRTLHSGHMYELALIGGSLAPLWCRAFLAGLRAPSSHKIRGVTRRSSNMTELPAFREDGAVTVVWRATAGRAAMPGGDIDTSS